MRLQKIYNLFQDPFERADFTSNTYWDWNLNQIGGVYGAMDEVFRFAATFEKFPPRAYPPSFVPTVILERTLEHLREAEEQKREAEHDGEASVEHRRRARSDEGTPEKRPAH